jgi:hypothetical protein
MIMGDKLNEWIDANSATLQALSGPGQPGIPPSAMPGQAPPPGTPPPAFPPGQPAAAGGFPPGAPQGSVRGVEGPYPPSAFGPDPQAPQASVRGVEGPYPPEAFGPAAAPQAVPVDVAGPQPGQAPPAAAPKPKPKGKDAMGFDQVMKDADPKQIDDAINVMETASGKSIEELYTAQTGAPPPKGMGKRKLGQALFEFGLNLMSAPAGLSDVETIGRAGQATIAGRRQREEREEQKAVAAEDRRIAAQERAQGRLDKKFDRAATLERLTMERQRTQAALDKPIGEFNSYVGPGGYMYEYNPETQEGRQVIVNGKPMHVDDQNLKTNQQRFDTEVRYNMYMGVYGKSAEGVVLTGVALNDAKKDALKYANRQKAYTRAEANTASINGATKLFANDTNYGLATPDEQRVMFKTKVSELTEMYMAGHGNDQGAPDAGRLSEGVATPVTNEAGITEYWTLKNGEPAKVPESQLQR